MSPLSLDSIKESTDKAVSFTEWFAEVWRSKNWVKKLLPLDVVLFLAFNPFSFPEILEPLPWPLVLPTWYTPTFWSIVGLIFVTALVVAVCTRPTHPSPEPPESKALKGLRPFRLEDAEIFARLQREDSLRDCLAAITDRDFRFGILCGESGCGKSSFLQAGLCPRLLQRKVPHHCVYVEFTDLDPLDSVRHALCETFPLLHETPDQADFLTLLGAATPSGSPPVVLLFDQFEQFFIQRPLRADREPLLQGLSRWYKGHPPLPVKILVCLRGDFLDRTIDLQKAMGYALGPGQSFRLGKFTPEEAAEIFRVIAETEELPFDEDFVREIAAQELVDRADGLVSPVDLQILAWMIKGQRAAEERAFRRSAYQKLGGLEGLLERFLSWVLQARETEARRQAALKVLLALSDLDRNARAGALTLEDLGTKLAGTVAAEEIREAVTWLARSDVRLATAVKREAAEGYELAHERLIPALRRLAGKELSAVDQANQLLERRVNEWLGNDRAPRYLLTRHELRSIRKQRPYLMWGVRKSQKEGLLTQSQRRLRVRACATSLVVLLSTSFSGWWYSPWGQIWQVERELVRLSPRLRNGYALRMVSIGFSKDGKYDLARQLAERIDDSFGRDGKIRAFLDLAEVAGNIRDTEKAIELLKQARQMARAEDQSRGSVDFPSFESLTLPEIAASTAKIGFPARAIGLLEEARQMARRQMARMESYEKLGAVVLKDVALATTSIALPRKAIVLLDRVRQAAGVIKDPSVKAVLLATITEAVAKHDDHKNATILLEKISGMVGEIGNPLEKVRLLASIAETTARINGLEKASLLLNQGRQMSEEITSRHNEDDKVSALLVIAETMVKIGGPVEKATTILEDVIQIADGIKDCGPEVLFYASSCRVLPFLEITKSIAKIAGRAKDIALLEKAHQTAKEVGDRTNSSLALAAIVEAMAIIASGNRDLTLLQQACKRAKKVDHTEAKTEAIRSITKAAVKIGNSGEAALAVDKIRQMAIGTDNLVDLRNIAQAYAKLGYWRQAREIADLNTSDDGRAIALAAILEGWAERQNPGLAEIRAGGVRGESNNLEFGNSEFGGVPRLEVE